LTKSTERILRTWWTLDNLFFSVFFFLAAFMFLFVAAVVGYKLKISWLPIAEIFFLLVGLFIVWFLVFGFAVIVQHYRNVHRCKK
jgi:hypothetical protein